MKMIKKINIYRPFYISTGTKITKKGVKHFPAYILEDPACLKCIKLMANQIV